MNVIDAVLLGLLCTSLLLFLIVLPIRDRYVTWKKQGRPTRYFRVVRQGDDYTIQARRWWSPFWSFTDVNTDGSPSAYNSPELVLRILASYRVEAVHSAPKPRKWEPVNDAQLRWDVDLVASKRMVDLARAVQTSLDKANSGMAVNLDPKRMQGQ